MKYGTQTRLKYLLPKNRLYQIQKKRSEEATRRQKWMDHYQKNHNGALTCRHFDIPLRTFWYWKKRYDKQVPNSLENKSRCPNRLQESPIRDEVRKRIIALREAYPGWGKVKIQVLLKREGIAIGQSRIQKVMNEAGLKRIPAVRKRIRRKNRKHIYTVPKANFMIPGGIVYIDVKHLRLADGNTKAYQFTALDHATRRLHVRIYSQITSLVGKKFLSEIEKLWYINYLGNDNGSEFLGKCDAYCEELGIFHVFSSPHSPRQNPYVERVIRTIIDELYYFQGTQLTCTLQQSQIDSYLTIYNDIRPHHSLALLTPNERYAILTQTRCSSSSVQHAPN